MSATFDIPSPPTTPAAVAPSVVLSFDVEEHHRIEAAAGLACPAPLRAEYGTRMESATRRLLDRLAAHGARATFFILGEIAHSHPALVHDIARAGHEVASHGWDHRRVVTFNREQFRDDLRKSKDTLEQAAGTAVVGYRAPTFSVDHRTPWAIDVLAEEGFRYDSSIFPVRHDRYGIPEAPRMLFRVRGERHELLELPLATWRLAGQNLPVAGGGYFRLFPLAVLEAGLRQIFRGGCPVATLYFHPWDFDPDQPRLPLGRLSRWRTYVGTRRSPGRLEKLLARHRFCRAADVAERIEGSDVRLERFGLAGCRSEMERQ